MVKAGRSHGAGAAAAGPGAVVARLARGRGGHRRLARGRARRPARGAAQRERRRGQGLGPQHPRLRPAERGADRLAAPAVLRRPPRGVRRAPAPRQHPRFREAFTAAAAAALTDDLLVRTQRVDAVVCGDDLSLALADELELLAPHGFGNPKVGLLLHDAQIVAPRLTRDQQAPAVQGALRRRLLQRHPVQLQRHRRGQRPGALRRAPVAGQERLQRRRERAGAGRRPAPPAGRRPRPVCRPLLLRLSTPSARRGAVALPAARRAHTCRGGRGRAGGRRAGRLRRPGARPPAGPPRPPPGVVAHGAGRHRRARAGAGGRCRAAPAAAQPRRAAGASGARRHVPAERLRRAPGRSAGRPGRGHGRPRPGRRAAGTGGRLRARGVRRPARHEAAAGAHRRGRAAGLAPCAVGPP